jgi:hypothetical protein
LGGIKCTVNPRRFSKDRLGFVIRKLLLATFAHKIDFFAPDLWTSEYQKSLI